MQKCASRLLIRLRSLFAWLPKLIRLQVYLFISQPGPSSDYDSPIRHFRWGIPLVLKRTDRTVSTEADALRFLNHHFPHPVIPRLLDVIAMDGTTYTLMTRIPGVGLLDLFENESMSDFDMQLVMKDVFSFLNQMARLTQSDLDPANAGQIVISASGDGLPNPVHFRESLFGPFRSTLDCYAYMARVGSVEDLSLKTPDRSLSCLINDPIVWVHTDLRMHNILVSPDGRLAGIIDWEDSGFLPRHWQLHVLRNPHEGCRGSWLRFWRDRTRFDFGTDTEEAYETSFSLLVYPL